jgi:hypothetical protein
LGSCPDWYRLLRAAKYLGVPPWELLQQPACWYDWALLAESAEVDAQDARRKQTKPRNTR